MTVLCAQMASLGLQPVTSVGTQLLALGLLGRGGGRWEGEGQGEGRGGRGGGRGRRLDLKEGRKLSFPIF